MSSIRYYLEQDPPEEVDLRGTPKQRTAWDVALEDLDQTPSEVAEEADLDLSYVTYLFKRTTPEELEEYRQNQEKQRHKKTPSANGGICSDSGDTHIYIFSDMKPEAIRDFLDV